MSGSGFTERRDERLQAIADLRRKFRRAAVAMSFMPAAELARHTGLPETGIAERLMANPRLSQRLYWTLVDSERVPDLSALPAVGALSLTDSSEAFENACVLIDGAMALRASGPVLPREQVKELARRYGDTRLKWLWSNRDIWSGAPSPAGAASAPAGAASAPAGAASAATADREPARRAPDSRRLLVNHLARDVPDVAIWMGREAGASPGRSGPDAILVAKLVDRLVHGGGAARHVH